MRFYWVLSTAVDTGDVMENRKNIYRIRIARHCG